MTASTHYAFSYLVTSVAGAPVETALAASLFSLLPDIDHPESLIGRIFPFASKWLLRSYGHRTVTHSVFAIVLISITALPFLLIPGGSGSIWFLSIVLAYASHIFIDLFNISGVKLLSPISQKEYISFRTQELRILVSSWKEYVLLFVIVFMAFSITGRSFSITGAVRSVGKLFYKNYKSALEEYHENSGYLCNAKLTWYDHTTREKITSTLPVLNMFQNEIYLYNNAAGAGNPRLIITKDDIEEIEMLPTEDKLHPVSVSGQVVKALTTIPTGSFVSGTITIKNYDPPIRTSQAITVQKGINSTNITLTSALPTELTFLTTLPSQVQTELEKLTLQLPENKEKTIHRRMSYLKSRIKYLNKRGFYSHYNEITRLNKELLSLCTRLETLKLNHDTGAVIELKEKIERAKGFAVSFDVVWVKFD